MRGEGGGGFKSYDRIIGKIEESWEKGKMYITKIRKLILLDQNFGITTWYLLSYIYSRLYDIL